MTVKESVSVSRWHDVSHIDDVNVFAQDEMFQRTFSTNNGSGQSWESARL